MDTHPRSKLGPAGRCALTEAIAVVDAGVARHGIEPGRLVLGSDNGSAFTSRGFRAHLKDLGQSSTAAAATATPSRRRSSSRGSRSSRSAASGAPSSRRSTKPERRSGPTSTATTAGPIRGSATGHH